MLLRVGPAARRRRVEADVGGVRHVGQPGRRAVQEPGGDGGGHREDATVGCLGARVGVHVDPTVPLDLDTLDVHPRPGSDDVAEVAPRRVHAAVHVEERADREHPQPGAQQRGAHLLQAREEGPFEQRPHDAVPRRGTDGGQLLDRARCRRGARRRPGRRAGGPARCRRSAGSGPCRPRGAVARPRIRAQRAGEGHDLPVDQEVATAAQRHRPQPVPLADLVEQGERARVEAGQPAGPGVRPVTRAVVLAVRAPADHAGPLRAPSRRGRLVGGGRPR